MQNVSDIAKCNEMQNVSDIAKMYWFAYNFVFIFSICNFMYLETTLK
jgi:hypothetical protein